ncbi:MAG: class I SAM-dependent methyltransferase [Nitrospinae bacterium]|nr:class I SAM-dependent methyltransferase [Nitrospinota bacterium]
MNASSAHILKRRSEWDYNANKYPDLCGMVGRPITNLEFSLLIQDIKKKLKVDSAIKGERFLDVGCGNSFLLSKIKNGMTSFGIDFSLPMIKKSLEVISDGGFAVGEVNKLPFDNNIFGRVLCYSVFHYFPDEEYAVKTITEMIRVCKKGGYIMIGDIPSLKNKKMLSEKELNSYSRQDRPGIHRIDEWLFYDLETLSKIIEDLKCTPQILPQPKELKTSHYRFDIVAKKNE